MSRSRVSAHAPRRTIAKPRGVFHPRVQHVGPEHFGIVCFDCAKARSKFLLADFYGHILIPPTTVEHNQPQLDHAIALIRQAFERHQLLDGLVAIERTGRLHQHVLRACSNAGFETRIIHPFVTKQFRAPVDPGYKTDDTDLFALHRATLNGCALIQEPLDEFWTSFRLLTRHRRDLVRKGAALNCQIRDHLQAAWPGFAECFSDLFDSPVAWHILRRFSSPEELRPVSLTSLCQSIRQADIRFQSRTAQAVLDWAHQASPGDIAASQHQRIALGLYDDRQRKTAEIQLLEREIAGCLVRTPYVLLLSFPGLNVVSAAEFAAEMGPIGHYAHAKNITGRAGLRPARYQSDQVDQSNGPLIKQANRSLRGAILSIAENLIVCNRYFGQLARGWRTQGKDARHTRVKVALRFCRIAWQMVAGGQVFAHPGIRGRTYILKKLQEFHRDHDSAMSQLASDMQAAVEHLPAREYAAEAAPLLEEMDRIRGGRRRGPQVLGEVLPEVLARLGVSVVESAESGE
jgi:transposase